jgi:hypothetical protein
VQPQLRHAGDDGLHCGCAPYFGFLTDDGRKADWIVEVKV